MEIEKYVAGSGKTFLTARDVIDNPNAKFVIINEGEFVINKFSNERLHLLGEFGKEKRIFDCSKTNAKTISDKLGTTDTHNCLGVILTLGTYRTKTNDGQLVDAIDIADVKREGNFGS